MKEKIKVIFLDIDGVLNSAYTWNESISSDGIFLDEEKFKYLKKIYDNNHCLIVLSSSWRKYFIRDGNSIVAQGRMGKLLDLMLNKYGMFIFDMTPKFGSREDEIVGWLVSHRGEVNSFLILDDSVNNNFVYNDNVIHTLWNDIDRSKCGLLESDIEKANDILSKKTKIKYNFKIKRMVNNLNNQVNLTGFGRRF